MEGREEEEEELREVRGGEREEARWTRREEQRVRRGYPDGFRCISGVLERLEILG